MILPDIAAPKVIADATAVLREAEQQLADVRARRQEAESGTHEAEVIDREELAARLAHDPQAKPSRKHRDKAQAVVDELVEVEHACVSNVERASEQATQAAINHLSEWQQAVETKRAKADATFSKALDGLREAESARAELRGVSVWLQMLQRNGRSWLAGSGRAAMPMPGRLDLRDPKNADSMLTVEHAIELLGRYAHESSAAGEREAEQRRLEAERAAEEHQQRVQEMRASAIQPR